MPAHVVLVVLMLVLSQRAGAAASSGEWAEGTIIVEGARIEAHHAYVRETLPGELQITISDVALDRALLKDEHDLMERARAGSLSALVIRVSANGQGQVSSTLYDRRLKNANTGGPDIGVLKATLSTEVADGTFTIPKQRTHYKETIEADVKFHALPAGGPVRNLDDFLDSHTGLRRFLDTINELFAKYIGTILLGGFGLLVISALLWALVIAPRRSIKILARLKINGYTLVNRDHPDVISAVQQLGPYSLEGPVKQEFKEFERVILGAALMDRRYIVNVSQMYEAVFYHSKTTKIWHTLFLEARSLPFSQEFYVRPRSGGSSKAEGRDLRYGLTEVNAEGLDPEFHHSFQVLSRDGSSIDIPLNLQKKLVSLGYNLIIPQELESVFRKDLLHGVNLKFSPRGWGICASNAWLDAVAMETLMQAGHAISESLSF